MSCGHLTTTYETQNFKYIVSDQIRSVTQSCPTLCDSMNRSTPGLPVHHQLPEFTQTHRPSSQWCHPAISSSVIPFSSCPQSLPASESFSMSTLHMRWPKYWSFSFSIIPSKEIPSQTRWTWVWVNAGRWWWTGRRGVLRFMGSQRVGHDWATELNWITKGNIAAAATAAKSIQSCPTLFDPIDSMKTLLLKENNFLAWHPSNLKLSANYLF